MIGPNFNKNFAEKSTWTLIDSVWDPLTEKHKHATQA